MSVEVTVRRTWLTIAANDVTIDDLTMRHAANGPQTGGIQENSGVDRLTVRNSVLSDTHGAVVNFPIIADIDRSIATLYGMLHPNHDSNHTVRTVFVVDPAKKVRLTIAYPQSCGRNFDELLRAIDSLQLTDAHGVATPAHWRVGDDVIILPSITDEEAHSRFPAGWHAPKPYLRLTPDPRA